MSICYNFFMNNNEKKINMQILYPDNFEEFMGWEPDIYDLYLDEENCSCRYKNIIVNLQENEVKYLKIVISRSRKNLYTKSDDFTEVFGIEAKSIDKIKERINKDFKKQANIKLILNKKGFGNIINKEIGHF